MPEMEPPALIRFLRKIAGSDSALTTDAELLRRFARQGDQAAFRLLLRRHGTMVLRTSLAILRHEQDAEDVFQAAFLTLARKAGSIGSGESVGAWLHRVACRIAFRLDRQRRQRAAREKPGIDLAAMPSPIANGDALADAESWRLLHEEVEQLPAKYRAPVVLCYLEGKTNQEAAAQLGWTKGTVSGRLARARDLLRRRLTRRGVSAFTGLALLPTTASAGLPAGLSAMTLRAAVLAQEGSSIAAVVSPHVVALTEGALRAMFMTPCKVIAATLLLMLASGTALIQATGGATGGDTNAGVAGQEPRVTESPIAQAKAKAKVVRVASPRDGIVLVVGTTLKEGKERYRHLKEGDLVEAGQMLAQLDDRLAQQDFSLAKAKLHVIQGHYESAQATANESQARLDRVDALRRQGGNIIPPEDYKSAVLARDKYREEAARNEQALKVAQIEVERAQIIVDMHVIYSPYRGVLQKIVKSPGEGVRALETIFEIRVETRK